MNLCQHWTLPNGTPLTLRPVQACDAQGLDTLVKGLTPQDRRWRFHGAVNALAPEQLRGMAEPEAARQLALVVLVHLPGRDALIADARCAIDATGEAAEFGLMVATGWRRLGVGARAMAALRGAASDAGLRWLHGSVLADNAPMLALMHRCGFLCTPSRRDASVVGVERQIDRETTWPRTPLAAAKRCRGSPSRNVSLHWL
jgi:GNAT superfamily N-acetyltransferase